MHRTLNVIIVFDGVEVELMSEVYFTAIWGEEKANKECDALVSLISDALT